MAKPLEHKKQQKILLAALAVVIVITAFVWYSNSQKKVVIEPGPATQPLMEVGVKNIKLDLDVLDDPVFKSLKSHGALPVTVEEAGRDNPFSPY